MKKKWESEVIPKAYFDVVYFDNGEATMKKELESKYAPYSVGSTILNDKTMSRFRLGKKFSEYELQQQSVM